MPILANAKKALRVSKKKTLTNRRTKSLLKTFIDKVFKLPTAETAAAAFSKIDRAVKKNVIHKNKAARMKSQISKVIATPAETTKLIKPAKTVAKKKAAGKKTAAKKVTSKKKSV
ncbi:MAG TPA: 30S ribosomal protein S20 [Candidatus Pacebacteria bacterium]|nr:30S ribosomal protein S20 [Candidatus Paceibacterota bacterium]